jgi:hypothetical protein
MHLLYVRAAREVNGLSNASRFSGDSGTPWASEATPCTFVSAVSGPWCDPFGRVYFTSARLFLRGAHSARIQATLESAE